MFSFSSRKIHNITEGRESELCYEFTLDLFTLVFLKQMFWANIDSFSNSFLSVYMTLKIHARREAAHVHRLFHFVFFNEGFWAISLVFFRTTASKTVASVLYTFYFLWNTIGSVDPKLCFYVLPTTAAFSWNSVERKVLEGKKICNY